MTVWIPVSPTDLHADDVILSGRLRARVLDWRWKIDRAECVVSARYLAGSPEPYANQDTECVFRLGETAMVWRIDRSEQGDEPLPLAEHPHP